MHLWAQNLIPNPGFEEFFTEVEYQWVQPQGPYYHYERVRKKQIDKPLSGNYENGICMYTMEPNEYLHIKLLQPLQKGKRYLLQVNARLMRTKDKGAHFQKYIGVYFGKGRIDTHIPGNLHYEPQRHLRLPEEDRYEWFLMTDTFYASGGETYLTMGYFPKTQRIENREEAQRILFERIDERYEMDQKSKETPLDKAWLYLPPDEQKKYIKEQQKKKKSQKKMENFDRQAHKPAKRPESEIDYSKIKSQSEPQVFAVRYYFDDLCLAPIPEDGTSVDCDPENKPEIMEEGKTIQLQNVFFATDSATLLLESEFQLEALWRMLNDYESMKIQIRGYTDNVGSDAYNLDLSDRRAKTVLNWLVEKGIDPNRLSSKGFGKEEPIETNDTEAGRARNRRVTFFIVEM